MRLMRLLPKSAFSTAVGIATRTPAPAAIHRAAIRAFARRYGVNLDEAALGVDGYRTFAEFFTRTLKPGLRPVDAAADAVVSPVDGAVSQIGRIEAGSCVQAKGVLYPVERLVGDAEAAKAFRGGTFATLYLSPKDYHRIHAPLDGEIDGYSYIPGQFWPVNPASVRLKDALFCVNERLVTWMRTPSAGRCAVVKVGATNVARIRATYDAVLTHRGQPGKVHRYATPIPIAKGAEIGVFEMGSTVILLFEDARVAWDASLAPESVVRMGRRIGTIQPVRA